MLLFDAPFRETCALRRSRSNTPLQALTMLNHTFTLDMAKALAERIQGAGSAEEQVAEAFRILYQREPEAEERERSVKAITTLGLVSFCRAILNSSELIYLD